MIAVFERCSFVSLTTSDLGRARRFWVQALGFPIIETRGIAADRGPLAGRKGEYAHLRDPDGRVVIVTEFD